MNYIVRIPEPCHEDWNKMQADEKGRFCNVCTKSVYDFSNKTDEYIHSVLKDNMDKQVCGHFKKSQLDRPLQLRIPIHQLSNNVSRANVFAVALFFVFGTFLFSCSNDNGQKIGDIGIEQMQTVTGVSLLPLATEDSVKTDTTVTDSTVDVLGETSIVEAVTGGSVSYVQEPMVDGMMQVVPVPEPQIIEPMVEGGISYRQFRQQNPDVTTLTVEKDSSGTERIVAPEKEFDMQVFPNPGTGEFNISYEVSQKGTVQADLYDMEGKHVRNIVKSQTQHTGRYVLPVNLGDLANGIYICKVIVNGKEQHEEVVIAK